MALILVIDTSLETAFVCLSEDGRIIASEKNEDPKQHGAFIQLAIKRLFTVSGIDKTNLSAVAVANGPGSYTGLRVGLSSAKGLCYTFNKPLIALNTLEILALSTINFFKTNKINSEEYLFCPMIDARRMEVFTGIYKHTLEYIIEPTAIVLSPDSFQELLMKIKIVFSGSGHWKLKGVLNHPNAVFSEEQYSVKSLVTLAEKKMHMNHFEDLAFVEPFYTKEFFMP